MSNKLLTVDEIKIGELYKPKFKLIDGSNYNERLCYTLFDDLYIHFVTKKKTKFTYNLLYNSDIIMPVKIHFCKEIFIKEIGDVKILQFIHNNQLNYSVINKHDSFELLRA